MRGRIALFVVAGLAVSAGLAQTGKPSTKLPVAPGAWIGAQENCAAARYINLYDGQRWGTVSFVTNDAREKAAGGLTPIVRTRTLKSGFTEVWEQDQYASPNDRSNFQVRPTGNGRMIMRSVAPDSGRIQSNGGRDIITDDAMKSCAFTSLAPRVQAAIREFAPGLDPRSGKAPSTAGALASNLRWSKHNFPDGPAAGAAGARSLMDFYVRCRGGAPVAEIMDMSGRRALNVRFTGTASGTSAVLAFQPIPRNSMQLRARLTPAAIALLRGRDPAVKVFVNNAPDGEISLMDAADALQHVAGQCPALGSARPSAPAAPTSNAMPAPVPPFNIAPGHYTEEAVPCGSTSGGLFYYDGRRWAFIDLSGPRANSFTPTAKSRKTKRGWYLDYSELARLGPGRVKIFDDNVGDTIYRWCPASSIPAGQRVR